MRPSAPTERRRVQIRRVSSDASATRALRLSMTTKSFPAPDIFENASGSFDLGCVRAGGMGHGACERKTHAPCLITHASAERLEIVSPLGPVSTGRTCIV